MKYQALRTIAFFFQVLAWVGVVIGIIVTTILGIRAVSPVAAIMFLLVGFVLTAIQFLVQLSISQFIYLFLEVREDLSSIAELAKKLPENVESFGNPGH